MDDIMITMMYLWENDLTHVNTFYHFEKKNHVAATSSGLHPPTTLGCIR